MAMRIGVRSIRTRFVDELKKIKADNLKGLTIAAAIIKRESQRLTPVDTGNLRASTYVSSNKNKNTPIVEIGCTADYATLVHEEIDIPHTVGQAKFLETAVNNSTDRIIKAVSSRLRR